MDKMNIIHIYNKSLIKGFSLSVSTFLKFYNKKITSIIIGFDEK